MMFFFFFRVICTCDRKKVLALQLFLSVVSTQYWCDHCECAECVFFLYWSHSGVSAQQQQQQKFAATTLAPLQVFCLLVHFFTCLSVFVPVFLWGGNVWNRPHQGLFLPSLWLRLHRSSLIFSPPLSVSPLCLSKTSRALPPSPHLLWNRLKCVFLLSFKILFIPPFFHLPFWPPCSPASIKKLPPTPLSNCSPLLYPCFLLSCCLSSHFSTVISHHSVFVANKVRFWLRPVFNQEPMNQISFSRKLQLRAECAVFQSPAEFMV